MSLPAGTFINRGRQLYASVSQSAENWYTFPAANGQIIMQDASGSQILEAIGTDLFYDGQLLAKSSDLQDIAAWSDYPVVNPAGVDFNGNPLKNATNIDATGTVTAGGALTVTGDISGSGNLTVPNAEITATSLTVSNGINTLSSSISTSGLSTNATIPAANQIVTGSVVTGTIQATTSAALKGASLTDPLDMTNNPINRASSINISNSGFAPYGQLTSPNGTQLLWNGSTINTGGAGDVSQWANYQAVAPILGNGQPISNLASVATTGDVTATGNIVSTAGYVTAPSLISDNLLQLYNPSVNKPLKVQGQNPAGVFLNSLAGGIASVAAAGKIESTATDDIDLTTSGGDVNVTAYNQVVIDSGNDISLTADPGINPLYTAAINLTAQNGNGGVLNLVANPGQVAAFGGVVNITGNGGTIMIPQEPPAPPISVTVGGEVNISANTNASGLYTLTSAVNINASCINSYAGVVTPLASVAGYNFIYGTAGVNICSGLPSAGFQLPLTTYIYGTGVPAAYGGVRLQSPNGIQMLSDTYMTNLYPLDTDGLNIAGRSFLGTGSVYIQDVATFEMNGGAALKTDNISSVSSSGILYTDNFIPSNNSKGFYANFVKPIQATAPGVPNLVISGNPFLGNNNYVQIQNADSIAFDATGTGALSGVQSINGAAWPPPTGDASLWSQYPATSVIDASGYGITNLSTINGQPVGDLTPAGWAAFPAIQNVDISANSLNNVGGINTVAGAAIISAGALSIFSDASGDLSLASNGGGDVNIGTGNAGDINISTGGAGNEVTIGGDVINLSATQGVRVSAPVLDMDANSIYNVNTLRSSLATDLSVIAEGVGNLGLEGTIITATAPTKVSLVTPSVDVNGADIINVANVTNEAANILTVQSTANLTVSAETALTLVSDSADVTVQGQMGITIYAATGDVSLTADSGEVIVQDSVLNMNTHKITNVTSGTATADAVNYGQLTFRDSTEFYVSSQGSDSNNGSILAPFLTIQAAITAAELISSAALVCVINVASGHYTENLTFAKGYITLNGSLQSQTGNEVCEITGSISVAVAGASDLFNRQISFQGFNITCNTGQAVNDTSTTPHIVSFQDCKVFAFNQFFVSTSAAADMRLYLTNVEIQQTNGAATLPVISTNVGQVELERVDISLTGNVSAIVIGGTSILSRFSLSALEATSTAATLLPMLAFTSNSTSTHTLGNVAFAFSSATTKANTSAVYINSGVNTTLLMLNSVFSLQGTSASTNYTVGYDGSGSPAILGVNNTSLNVPVLLPQTTAVQTGITQISYTDINPPVMGAYSKSGDQSIAAANTPVAITFNTTQFQQGTALATTRLQVSQSGNYQVNWQVQTQASVAAIVTTYLSKNGTALPNTGSQYTNGTGSQVQTSPQFIISLNSGDYIELYINSNSLGTIVNSTAAAAPLPAIPGALITITQIR